MAQATLEKMIEQDQMQHIEDTRLFWVWRNGRACKRAWNEMSTIEKQLEREAQARAYYETIFNIY